MGKTKPEERRLLSGYSIDSRCFFGSNEYHRLLSWVKLKPSANPNIDDSHLNSHNIIPQPTCQNKKQETKTTKQGLHYTTSS